MSDQAATLRTSASTRPLPAVAVTGGKGGIGKTCIAVNLALHLAKLGAKVCLVDLDLGLANADVLLGIDPKVTLADVIERKAPLESAITAAPAGLSFVPAASGVDALARLTPETIDQLFMHVQRIAERFDLLVLDTPAGIGREVIAALARAKVSLVVTTPEPTALADAYALIKVVEQAHPGRDLRVLVNQARSQQEAAQIYGRLNAVAQKHLLRSIPAVGSIPADPAVAEAVRRRRPLALGPDSPANLAIRTLAQRLRAETWR